MNKREYLCQITKCMNECELYYYGKGVCRKHWDEHCNKKKKFNLKEELKIED